MNRKLKLRLGIGGPVLAALVAWGAVAEWNPKWWAPRERGPGGHVVAQSSSDGLTAYLIEENLSPSGFFNTDWTLRVELWRSGYRITTRLLFADDDVRHGLPNITALEYSAESGIATVHFHHAGEARTIEVEVGSGQTKPHHYLRSE